VQVGDFASDQMQQQAQTVARKVNAVAGTLTTVGLSSRQVTSNVTYSSPAWGDTNITLTLFNAQAGDVLVIDFAILGASSSAACQTRIAVTDGGTQYTNASSEGASLGVSGWYTNTAAVVAPHRALWTVRTRGTIVVTVQALAGASSTLTLSAAPGGIGGVPALYVQQMRAV
jgi:hypothetical protein